MNIQNAAGALLIILPVAFNLFTLLACALAPVLLVAAVAHVGNRAAAASESSWKPSSSSNASR